MTQVKMPMVKFGIFADLQYCDAPPFKNRYYKNSLEKLDKTIDLLNTQNLDFVVNLGDMIDRDWPSYDEVLPLFCKFKAPVYHVLGNHDYEVPPEKKPLVPSRIGTEQYYDFSKNGWRFIVLDGNEISTFANAPGTAHFAQAEKLLSILEHEQKLNANFWNGGMGEYQISWLESILSDAMTKKEKVMIFCHYPLFPSDKHNLLNNEKLLTLLKNYKCVKMWMNGHNHKGNYGLFENIHFVNVKGMVEGVYERVCSIVDLYENEIGISGYGNEISARVVI